MDGKLDTSVIAWIRHVASFAATTGFGEGEPPRQTHSFSKSEFFRGPLPAEGVASLVENFREGRVDGQSRERDFTPWGGAYNRVSSDAKAFVHRDELFLLKHAVEIDPDAPSGDKEAARSCLKRSWA